MTTTGHTILTKHAQERIQERVGVSKRGQQRLSDTAYVRGYHLSHTKGALYQWIKFYIQQNGIEEPRIYGDKVYLFNQSVLVTVIQLPQNFAKNLPKYIRKPRKEKRKMTVTQITAKENPSENVYNRGEIWTFRNGSGEIKECLILSVLKRYCLILMLQENETQDSNLTVRSKKLMHADSGKISFVFYDKIDQFIRELSEEDFEIVREAVLSSLNLGNLPSTEEASGAPALGSASGSGADEALTSLRELLQKAQIERDIYQRLYNELLSQTIGRKEGA